MDYIRNVCILAHVDHGKTSLADVLISPSGVISQRSAGDLRFMDSTIDEQQRGITMKSSAISLTHQYFNKLKVGNEEKKKYFINLIDSPGHVDFSGEVSTAVKISDNAFILVDVVEGVCPQTRTVLQQAWKEGLNFILVLNKIDKLHSELKLSTTEAYNRLMEIIENVHHIIGELISYDVKEEEEKNDSILTKEVIAQRYETMPFHPLKGRVVFCSAFHHWGFRISDFIDVYSKILGLDKQELYKKMWGDFYINSKKSIVKGAIASNRKNLFTSLILDQIWSVYNALDVNDVDKVVSMMSKLDIRVAPKKYATESSPQILNIRHVLNSWMPLCTVLLDTLIEKCPNPRAAITDKKLKILVPNEKFARAREILKLADTSPDAPVVTFISKVMLRQNGNEEYVSKELIAFGRIFSGFMKPGMKAFLFSPRFNPYKVDEKFFAMTPDDFEEGPINLYQEDLEGDGNKFSDVYVFRVNQLFLFIGQDTIILEKGTSAGYIIGMTGLDWHTVHKNAIVVGNCSVTDSLGMFSQYDALNDEGNNIICVSIEPKKIAYLTELREAMQLLEKADPIVDVKILATGEMLLYTAGEIHLQKCINDLMRIVPHIELDISPPIVPFRETIIHRSKCNPELFLDIEKLSTELHETKSNVLNSKHDTETSQSQQGILESNVVFIRLPQKIGTTLCASISVHSLPRSLIDWTEKNAAQFFRLTKAQKRKDMDTEQRDHLYGSLRSALAEATKEDAEECVGTETVPIDYSSLLDQFWTMGDHQSTQCNLLFSYVGHWGLQAANGTDEDDSNQRYSPFYHAIVKGFLRALKAGPICQEPIKNVAFVVHSLWEMSEKQSDVDNDDDSESDEYGRDNDLLKYDREYSLTSFICNPGQLSNCVTKACQVVLISHPGARLMVATYKLDLEIRIPQFKNLSSIINQLHGDIVQQEVNVGNFVVEARIPVIESFGFGDKLRKKTSGEVSLPQLKTVLWQVLDCYPLLDLKMYGALSDMSDECALVGLSQELVTRTQGYMNSVRQRKGLQVRQQIVECGDKQRTLAKKK